MVKQLSSIGVGTRLLICLLLLLPLFAAGLPASAQEGEHMHTIDMIASGLNNPRGLTFGPDGAVYVAEAGVGGANCYDLDPSDPALDTCVGQTGSITRVADGGQSRVAEGFASLAGPQGFGASGATDISFQGNGAFIIVGLGADPAMRDEMAASVDPLFANFGQLVHMPRLGKWRNLVDVSAYEAAANPDGGAVDSNPYSVAALSGKRVVTDAGGNSLVSISPKGEISTLAVFPPHMWEVPPEGLPFPGGPPPGTIIPIDAVPTSVVRGPDGAYYVGELASITTGEANVWRVPADGSPATVYATGFTAIIDIAFMPDGSLLVLEIFKNGLLAGELYGDMTGALIHVMADGMRMEMMSDGLVAPGGLAVAPDGTVYVTNFSIFPGMGEVLRISHHGEHHPMDVLPSQARISGPLAMPESSFLHVDVERLNELALDNTVFLPVLPR